MLAVVAVIQDGAVHKAMRHAYASRMPETVYQWRSDDLGRALPPPEVAACRTYP